MPDWIYGLVEPDTKKIRYIGKTNNLKERFWDHMAPSNLVKNRPVCEWIKSLKAVGTEPEMIIIELVPEGSEWQDSERYWIAKYRESEDGLLNVAPGGEAGVATYGRLGSKWTQEQHINYSKTRTGMKVTPPSPELCKKRGEAIKRHWDEVRVAMGGITGKKGGVHTKESKSRIGLSHKGKPLSLRHRKKLRLAKLGKKQSAEHVENRFRKIRERMKTRKEAIDE